MDMKSKFSEKVKHLEASAIREMFKLMIRPEIISFAGGSPASELFPKDELAEIAKDILQNNSGVALQYGVTEGYAPLAEWVEKRLDKVGIVHDTDSIIIVSGGQQGIDLAAKSLLNAGDGVVCEEPSFIGGLNSFRSYNAEIYGVGMEDDGIDTDELEKTLKAHPNIKVLYTIATFQNPTGITMSLEKRKKVLELAEKYDFIIFEDNPYGELRFAGEDIPTIKSLDTYNRVVYFGSFSKILAPGLRLGFSCADKYLTDRMVVCKQVQDVHTSLLPQMLAYEFVTRYSIDEHISKLRKVYGSRCRLMIDCMEKYFPKCITHTNPQGGLFLFCTMPDGYDTKIIMQKAVEQNVAFVPGATTMIDISKTYSTFRMNYSASNEEKIETGIKRLGKVLYDTIGE